MLGIEQTSKSSFECGSARQRSSRLTGRDARRSQRVRSWNA